MAIVLDGTTGISASGNITVGGTLSAGEFSPSSFSATGNVSGGNIATSGLLTVTGNITGGNLVTAGVVTATGNITGDYFIGNGALLTGIDTNPERIANGTSNLDIPIADSNIVSTVDGNTIAVFHVGGIDVTGVVSASGNIDAGNLATSGLLQAQDALILGNLTVDGNTISVNITELNVQDPIISLGRGPNNDPLIANDGKDRGEHLWYYTDAEYSAFIGRQDSSGKLIAAANVAITNEVVTVNAYGTFVVGTLEGAAVDVTGNVIGGNIITAGNMLTTGNIDAGNISVSGLVGITGNIDGGNIATPGAVDATGNITGGNVLSLGSMSATGNVTGGNITTTGLLAVSGNAEAGNVMSSGELSATGNVTGGNIVTLGSISAAGSIAGDDLVVLGNAVIDGDLTVNGELAYVNVETLNVEDPVISLGRGANNDPLTSDDGKDRGTQLWYYDTTEKAAFIGFSNSTNELIAAVNVTVTGDVVTVTEWGNLQVGNLDAAIIDATAGITGDTLTAYSNISGGNLAITGLTTLATVTASGNIDAGNIVTGGQVSAAANILGANLISAGDVTTATVNATGNITGGNIVTAGDVGTATVTASSTVSAVGNVTGGNIVTAGDVTTATVNATGNITGGNIVTTGAVSTTANVIGGNIVTAGDVTTATVNATGNITGGNIATAGLVTVTGNITGGNIITAGDVSTATVNATSNITGGNLVTAGTANVNSLISSTTVSATGNVTGGNLVTAGLVTATGNLVGGNILTGGYLDVTGNISGGNINIPGLISALGNITGGNVDTAGIIIATGNVTGGNIVTGGDVTTATVTASSTITATGNITGGNIVTAGDVSTGTVTASSTVSATGNITGGNVVTAGLITATGNVTGGNVVTAGDVDTATVTASSTVSAAGNVTGGNLVTAGVLSVTGTGVSAFSGNVDLNSKHVLNLAEPVNASDAATKQYVDTLVASGIHFHTAVRVESPAPLNATYNNGTDGVGATLTNAGANEALVIDGVSVNVADRVLIYEQADATQNGVYVVTTVGDGSTPWVLTRSTDADSYNPSTDDGLDEGSYFFVQEGATGAGESYVVSTVGEIVFGTTNINFVQFSSAQVYQAGTGLTLTGTTFSVNASQTQITAVGTLGSLSATGNIDGGNVSGTRGAFTNVAGTLETAAQTNITSVGTLTSLSVTGNVTAGNVSGTSIVGTLETAAQTNITSVGTLSSLSVTGNVTGGNLITAGLVSVSSIAKTGSNGVGNIGGSTSTFDTVFAKATSAQYADVAEYYVADQVYAPGTVLEFGGNNEVQQTTQSHTTAIAGVVSSNPAVIMNSGLMHDNRVIIALLGRVPCRVQGPVNRGDLLVAGSTPGTAVRLDPAQYQPGCVIGKALDDCESAVFKTIEVVVGRL